MAPKSKSTAEPMKQKSLMSFFGKSTNATPNAKAKGTLKPVGTSANDASMSQPSSQEPSSQELRTPESKSRNIRALNSSAMASSTSSRGRSTPPTSDPVDVDMLSSDEEDHPVQKMVSSRSYCATVYDAN